LYQPGFHAPPVSPEAEKLSKQFSNCGLPSLLFWAATGFDGRKYFLFASETVKKLVSQVKNACKTV
jgi:hypothetical protein